MPWTAHRKRSGEIAAVALPVDDTAFEAICRPVAAGGEAVHAVGITQQRESHEDALPIGVRKAIPLGKVGGACSSRQRIVRLGASAAQRQADDFG